MFSTKDQGKSPEKDLSKTEMNNLKELKLKVLYVNRWDSEQTRKNGLTSRNQSMQHTTLTKQRINTINL